MIRQSYFGLTAILATLGAGAAYLLHDSANLAIAAIAAVVAGVLYLGQRKQNRNRRAP